MIDQLRLLVNIKRALYVLLVTSLAEKSYYNSELPVGYTLIQQKNTIIQFRNSIFTNNFTLI